jgi:hypothetical protein
MRKTLTIACLLCWSTGIPRLRAQNGTAGMNVWTQHNNNRRSGWMDQEFSLTPETVNSPRFGLLFTRAVDDKIYGQPLYVQWVNVAGAGMRNIVLVATASDTIYAFDAENPNTPAPLWRTSLLGSGETPGSAQDVGLSHRTTFLSIPVCGSATKAYTDMVGNIGVTGTPVVDLNTRTLYAVSKSRQKISVGLGFSILRYHQRLHALDITNGHERPGFPVEIQASVPGSNEFGATSLQFNAVTQNQRAALALVPATPGFAPAVLVAWGSHGDAPPYHGWLMAFDATTGENIGVLNTTPHIREMDECGSAAGGGSVWQAGQGPTLDEFGSAYIMTGNGQYNPNLANYGSSILRISLNRNAKRLSIEDFFTPANWEHLTYWDVDIGSAGALLLPGLLIGGGKEGRLYTLHPSSLGGLQSEEGSNGFWAIGQHIGSRHIHGSPVAWSTNTGWMTFVWPENDWLRLFSINHTGPYGSPPLVAHSDLDSTCPSSPFECMPGGMLSISSNGTVSSSGILWASLPDKQNALDRIVPGCLVAFRATPLGNTIEELWRSDLNPPYTSASHRTSVRSDYNFSKFSAPTIANGRVYLSTFSNQLRVYGLR